MNILEKYRIDKGMSYADLGRALGCSWKWARNLCLGGDERLLPMRVQFAIKVEKATGINLINELQKLYGNEKNKSSEAEKVQGGKV